jgi:hypothetical protein
MVRAPWNRETQGGLAIIIGPTADPAARKSFALLEPLAPGSRNGNENAAAHRFWRASIGPLAPIAPPPASIHRLTMRIERGSCSDLNSKAREWPIRPIESRQQVTTAPVFRGPPKQQSGMPPAVSTPLRQ